MPLRDGQEFDLKAKRCKYKGQMIWDNNKQKCSYPKGKKFNPYTGKCKRGGHYDQS